MNLCSDGHEEVCYEGRSCPACDLLEQIKDLKRDNDELESQVDKLDSRLAEAEARE